MADLSTTYLGLQLASPLVASPSPLTGELDSLRALEAAGAGAVVLPSVFEEQVALDDMLDADADAANRFVRRGRHAVDVEGYNAGPSEYLRLVQQASRRLQIPVIASVNCARPASWPLYARMLEDAGADAIELNAYLLATDAGTSGQELEDAYVDLVASAVASVHVPVSVKLTPFLTAPVHLAARLEAAGASGLVLFHRLHEPALDLARREVTSTLSRSTPAELGVRLRWIGILRRRINISLAATGGVWDGRAAATALFAGADAVMLASVLLQHGPAHLETLRRELEEALGEAGVTSVEGARGLMALAADDSSPDADRAAYLRALLSRTTSPGTARAGSQP